MRNRLEYTLFICVATLVRALPRPLALTLGGWLGSLSGHLQPRRARIARENLALAFPGQSPDDISATVAAMFRHLGVSFIDMLRLDAYDGPRDLERFFTLHGREHLGEALALGRGCVVLTGHVGFWEAGNFIVPQLGHPFAVVAKPMRNPLVDDFFARMRRAKGTEIINSRKGARAILKALQENKPVGLLLDQHMGGQGSVSVPFFGRPAHTTTIITQMAIRYRVPVVTAFAYRRADTRYEVFFEPMFFLDEPLDEAGIRAGTALLNEKLEAAVRRDVSQWFWLHRRWRPCCEEQG